jgi:uncharacterized protein YegL
MARTPGVDDSLGRRARVSSRSVGGRLPLVLVIDRSKSMLLEGRGGQLNEALNRWLEELRADRVLHSSVDLAVVTFGGAGEVDVLPLSAGSPAGFMPVREVADVPPVRADGSTPLGAAIDLAIELAAIHVTALRTAQRDVYRPNVWIVTDGEPTGVDGYSTDDWRGAVARLRAAEASGRLLVFAVGLPGADGDVLAEIAPLSHYADPRLSLARALRIVSISSRETVGRGSQSHVRIYARVRELLGVDEHGNLIDPERELR